MQSLIQCTQIFTILPLSRPKVGVHFKAVLGLGRAICLFLANALLTEAKHYLHPYETLQSSFPPGREGHCSAGLSPWMGIRRGSCSVSQCAQSLGEFGVLSHMSLLFLVIQFRYLLLHPDLAWPIWYTYSIKFYHGSEVGPERMVKKEFLIHFQCKECFSYSTGTGPLGRKSSPFAVWGWWLYA